MSENKALESGQNLPGHYNRSENRPCGMGTRQFWMLKHLAQFAGYIVPFSRLILHIMIVAGNKELNDEVGFGKGSRS